MHSIRYRRPVEKKKKLAVEDMIKLRFTQGVSVDVFESAENRMTPLMVLPWGT